MFRSCFVIFALAVLMLCLSSPGQAVDRSGPPRVSEPQAAALLLKWLDQHNHYALAPNCIQTKSLGLKNAGYTIEILSLNCPGRTAGTILGRWRVDAYTSELFVQNADGKYHAPKPHTAQATLAPAQTPVQTPEKAPPAPVQPTVAPAAKPLPPLQEIEEQLCFSGYSMSLAVAEDYAATHGAALVPILQTMLDKAETYVNDPMFTGAFPYNAVWILAHVGSDAARKAIERFAKNAKDAHYSLALAGLDLRRKFNSPDYAVLHSETSLRDAASLKSKTLRALRPGQAFRILKPWIENHKEEGPRGGPAVFDAIELVPSREKGYVERQGTGEAPYY